LGGKGRWREIREFREHRESRELWETKGY
jgi:hypothetical protein